MELSLQACPAPATTTTTTATTTTTTDDDDDAQAIDPVRTPQAVWHLPNKHMAGVLFYRWDPYYHGGAHDTGYGIAGKPASEIIKNWLDGKE